MKEKSLVNVWVYTSSLEDFFNGEEVGYLYPFEAREQTQLLIPYEEIQIKNEASGTCKKIKKNVSIS